MPWLTALWAKVTSDGFRLILHIIAIALLVLLAYAMVIKPFLHPNPTQKADTINNYDYKIGFGGCARIYPEVKR